MTKKISFVSFKGGAGRSVGLANVAFQLSKDHRVGCIDFDIEGGGLHTVFAVGDIGKQSIQHYLMDEEDYYEYHSEYQPDFENQDTFINRLVIDVKSSPVSGLSDANDFNGELFLIQAELNASLTSMIDTGTNLFYRFHKLLEKFSEFLNLDYILIDCRSGISNLGLPGLAYSDLTLVFLRWGKQHRFGTVQFVKWYNNWLVSGDIKTKIMLVASTIKFKKVTQQTIADYCTHDLEGIPVVHRVIPEIPKLIDNELIFWDSVSLELQKPFIDVSEAVINNTKKDALYE
jgi:MinD-like ATPase involved in chromosome partitioning or flagellar assembly